MSGAGRAKPNGDSNTYTGVAPVISSGNVEAVSRLAADARTAPEVLFLLSQYPVTNVRKDVAANQSTPDAADQLLLTDSASEVRAALGSKLAKLLPELAGEDAGKMRDAAAAKLLILARDRDVAVRRSLAADVCALDCIPKELAATLVRDIDVLVSAPIAEFSPLLDDNDLIALIGESPGLSVLAAVARRPALGRSVVDRLVETGDRSLIASLLRNSGTSLREATLELIANQAAAVTEWHEPLVHRAELTEALIGKLSTFIGDALIDQLATRNDLPPGVVERLRKRGGQAPKRTADGELTEDQIVAAVARESKSDVISAIAARSRIAARIVGGLFDSQEPRSMVALAWKAGLSAQAAMVLQRFPGHIDEDQIIKPAPAGGYAISRDELKWLVMDLEQTDETADT